MTTASVKRYAAAWNHVVPLQDLVQHDAVEEAAQAEAEQDAGRGREAALLLTRVHPASRAKHHSRARAGRPLNFSV